MNWGKGITIFLVAFIIFIASMVYHAFTLNADLVTEDYYELERLYDADKESRLNYVALKEPVVIEKTEAGIIFRLPHHVSPQATGTIHFYRPDEKKLDRNFELALNDDREQVLSYDHFAAGYYEVSIHWEDPSGTYLFEDHIQF